jgi:HD-GYP domain-containing protein (c-di-GMP phosphodiesterase class II)
MCSTIKRLQVKVIDINKIVPGQVTEGDYYSTQGELLISRGVTLTAKLIDALKRRNIFELHIINAYTESSTKPVARPARPDRLDDISGYPKAFALFSDIEPGIIGYEQLLRQRVTSELDKAFRFGRIHDDPMGKALRLKMKQLYLSHRPDVYKKEISSRYSDALNEVKVVLNSLSNAEKFDTLKIRHIIEQFMDTFVNDRNILLAIANVRPDRQNHLYHHALNVCLLSLSIAANSGFSEEQVIHIGMGALLHDVGMLLIPKEIRLKKGRLTEDEWYEIRKHPLLGIRVLDKLLNLPDTVKYIAYQMHERINGKGYPKQHTGNAIHNYAKIAQIADIFEAISSPRTYREAFEPYRGMEMLVKMTHSGMLHEEYVRAFLSSSSLFPVGSLVELSDSRIAKVISANSLKYDKPIVSVLVNIDQKLLNDESIYQIDLLKDQSVRVVRSLPCNTLACDMLHGF